MIATDCKIGELKMFLYMWFMGIAEPDGYFDVYVAVSDNEESARIAVKAQYRVDHRFAVYDTSSSLDVPPKIIRAIIPGETLVISPEGMSC